MRQVHPTSLFVFLMIIGGLCAMPALALDTDYDGVEDHADNAPQHFNPMQIDTDGDALGDIADSDIDNDTVLNHVDNAPTRSNTDQADADADGFGDAIDSAPAHASQPGSDWNLTLTLPASVTYDPFSGTGLVVPMSITNDHPDNYAVISWDLDDDGVFGDVIAYGSPNAYFLSHSQLSSHGVDGSGNDISVRLDNRSNSITATTTVNAIPEPASLAALAVGGMLLIRRRRNA